MSVGHRAEDLMEAGPATPCFRLDHTMDAHDDLANHIYWRFGVSEKSAASLANDIYKIIEN